MGDDLLSMPNAKDMPDEEMRGLPRLPQGHGHMTRFVFPTRAADGSGNPSYELDKCAHAMIGTMWLLSKLGMVPRPNSTS
ncbi:hypothetical protein N7519_009917 [Penicillium mononematosum]|uniref:uncharacterized protein n=1 Tax=Penicillium mononematosum TaxID=268346 RepID=UPI0025471B1D|nr:uncharacterized protein N7519_009917 [Penicillium mononematosum]KAJ6179456.1 hypothetical protein N7519_009917 [Penicillium mononematosum]